MTYNTETEIQVSEYFWGKEEERESKRVVQRASILSVMLHSFKKI